MVDAAALSALSGRTVTAEQADAATAIVTSLARSYTRGQGFGDDGDPAEDLQAVIASSTLRWLMNPTGLQSDAMGPFQQTYGREFLGWTLTELFTLNRYRDRAR